MEHLNAVSDGAHTTSEVAAAELDRLAATIMTPTMQRLIDALRAERRKANGHG